MARPALLDALQRIAEPVARSRGLDIWGIDIMPTSRPVVRIYVDVPPTATQEQQPEEMGLEAASASIDQCAEISRLVGLAMEVEDVFASAYVLEVSSPGLSRPFFQVEQLPAYVGDTIEVVLNDPMPEFPGRKKFRGRLLSVQDQTFCLAPEGVGEGAELCVDWINVRKAHRLHVFVDPEKPGKKRKDGKDGK